MPLPLLTNQTNFDIKQKVGPQHPQRGTTMNPRRLLEKVTNTHTH